VLIPSGGITRLLIETARRDSCTRQDSQGTENGGDALLAPCAIGGGDFGDELPEFDWDPRPTTRT
jgi:hypothetical protein